MTRWRLGTALALRPWLWPVAIAQAFRIARRGWWRRLPFLPLPDREYLRFRMDTAYGSSKDLPEADDFLAYLRWCRSFPVRG